MRSVVPSRHSEVTGRNGGNTEPHILGPMLVRVAVESGSEMEYVTQSRSVCGPSPLLHPPPLVDLAPGETIQVAAQDSDKGPCYAGWVKGHLKISLAQVELSEEASDVMRLQTSVPQR
ncbi:hypothetical protein DPEC_G00278770 [Dallia pectoralis]|uniref:Uncharacterized protein n=1 Tax=Dallia pectoralis TaxID=75939 RepID=A0ACC2FM65_DALPE|nr:hypothetical protein DPEC_G00278770 [Dallia pectoralis]